MKGVVYDYEMVYDVCFRNSPYRSAIMSISIMNIFLDSNTYFVDLCFYLALIYSTCSSAM